MITFTIIIIIIVVWCWYFLWNHPNYNIVRWKDIQYKCKTGDLILFHGLDNYNSIFTGCYYGHIGIVYRKTPKSKPYLFEAWNPVNEKFYPSEVRHGIAFTDLDNRIKTYRGYVFYKPLMHQIPDSINIEFYNFIYWAVHNMKYNTKVIRNGINKLLLNDKLKVGTNCGELAYLSLIKLGLLNLENLHNNNKHHLNWTCNIKNLDNTTLLILYANFKQA